MFIVPPIRGSDQQGCGYFGASRGARLHNGVDFVAQPGDPVRAFLPGVVTKLGYPYAGDLSFRYVEVQRPNGDCVRYFYVSPTVETGDRVAAGDMLGTCQALPYEGITPHYHFEVRVRGQFVDPIKYLCDTVPGSR